VNRRVLTIPNLISAVRVGLVPLFLWLLFGADAPTAAGLLLGVIGGTDWIDGYLARRLGQVSELGKVLDPIADRLAITAAVIGGWIAGVLPWPVALALVVRESVIALGAVLAAWLWRARVEVRYLGKVATFALYSAIGSFYVYAGFHHPFFIWWAWAVVVPGLVLYYAVGVQYFVDVMRARREEPAVSSS
jgi:cardiolipin synthase